MLLGIDLGQPLRLWFMFWHANVHSMLVEVSFCITCYMRTGNWMRYAISGSSVTTSII